MLQNGTNWWAEAGFWWKTKTRRAKQIKINLPSLRVLYEALPFCNFCRYSCCSLACSAVGIGVGIARGRRHGTGGAACCCCDASRGLGTIICSATGTGVGREIIGTGLERISSDARQFWKIRGKRKNAKTVRSREIFETRNSTNQTRSQKPQIKLESGRGSDTIEES